SPDAERNEGLVKRWCVFDDFPQRRGNETGDDQAHALLDPDPNNAEDASEVEPLEAAADGQDEQEHGDEVENNGGPDPWNEGVVAVQPEEEVLGRDDVEVAGVKLLEHFVQEQKYIDQHRNLHDAAQGHQRAIG